MIKWCIFSTLLGSLLLFCFVNNYIVVSLIFLHQYLRLIVFAIVFIFSFYNQLVSFYFYEEKTFTILEETPVVVLWLVAIHSFSDYVA